MQSNRGPLLSTLDSFALTYTPYHNPLGDTDRVVYLTFDDGPHETLTPTILQVLREEGAKGTFFVVGRRLEHPACRQVLVQAVADGHCIGNHTFTHADLTSRSEAEIEEELASTSAALNSLGARCRFFRPPYGRINDLVIGVASRLDLQVVLWDNDPRDWVPRSQPTEWVDDAIAAVHKRNARLILCHDIHERTAANVRQLLVRLLREGYRFVTLEEGRDGIVPREHGSLDSPPNVSTCYRS